MAQGKRFQSMRDISCVAGAVLAAILWDLRDTPTAISAFRMITPSAFASPSHSAAAVCSTSGVVAAALRNDGNGWYAINDGEHRPINIAAVRTTLQSIEIEFSHPLEEIHSVVVAPDEVMAIHGYSAGASVGMRSAQIYIGRAGMFGAHRVSPLSVSTVSMPWSNLWVYGIVTMPCSG